MSTSSRVGVILGPDWELRVQPRLRIPQLLFLLGYARDPGGWRRQQAVFGAEAGLLDAMAEGFSHQAVAALDRGILRGYVGREDRVARLRGRVLFAQQAARGGGLPVPTHVGFDDFTVDVIENRMLLTAARLLVRLPRITPAARRRLLRVASVLDDVSAIADWRGTRMPVLTRLNARFGPALRLAELVLSAASVSGARGETASTTFVFDMNVVFENFLETALRETMRPYGGVLRGQDRIHSLDEEGLIPLRPDIAWWDGNRCRAVIDAKYKAIEAGVMRNGDAYQMLAYCTAYDLRRGYLVYARDSGQVSRTHRVRHSGHEIVVTAIDVEQQPDTVLAQVARLAEAVASAEPS